MTSRPPAAAFAALIVGNVALAVGPWFVRLADIGPEASAFWRLTLAAPILAAAAMMTGQWPRRLSPAIWRALVVGGVFFAADLIAWHLGILRAKLANATLFGNSASLLFPLWGFIVARAWPNRPQAAALLLAAIGAGLLLGRSFELSRTHLAGDLLCLLAGVFYTGYLVAMVRARDTLPPLPTIALSTLAGIPALGVAVWVSGGALLPQQWWPLVALAIGSQVIGQGLTVYALGVFSPLVVGIALLSQPIVGGAIGWFAYGETLGPIDFAGAVLVGVALVLVRRDRPPLASAGEAAT